jgi:hypothetical protein
MGTDFYNSSDAEEKESSRMTQRGRIHAYLSKYLFTMNSTAENAQNAADQESPLIMRMSVDFEKKRKEKEQESPLTMRMGVDFEKKSKKEEKGSPLITLIRVDFEKKSFLPCPPCIFLQNKVNTIALNDNCFVALQRGMDMSLMLSAHEPLFRKTIL